MTGRETWSRRAVEELFAAHIARYITGHTARCRRWAGIGPLLDWLDRHPGRRGRSAGTKRVSAPTIG